MTPIKHNPDHPDIKEIETAIEHWDRSYLEIYGGYPSQWIIFDDQVIQAKPDHDGAAQLKIWTVKELLFEWREYKEEMEIE